MEPKIKAGYPGAASPHPDFAHGNGYSDAGPKTFEGKERQAAQCTQKLGLLFRFAVAAFRLQTAATVLHGSFKEIKPE